MSDYARIPEANIENYDEKDTEIIDNKMKRLDNIYRKVVSNVMNNKLKYIFIVLNLVFNETCDTLNGSSLFHTVNNYVFWYFSL